MIQRIDNPFELKEDPTDFPMIFDLSEPEAVADDVQDILSLQSRNERNSVIGL